ncbi:MAG TPA: UMP kinase [Oceanipulchritudo sp.]|nr:UMP kinase [Oceanipulchritudo sp.]
MDATAEGSKPRYKRIILKISGEVLRCTQSGETIDATILHRVCEEIKSVYDLGVEIGLVVGGGNIFRGLTGAEKRGVARTTGDYMGMLATVINGMALMDCLEKLQVPVRVVSAIEMDKVAEPYILRRATRHLEKKRVVIFVGGTGNPYFSTDTTASLRANEIGAEAILKATKVDGVYNKDPMIHSDAVKYDEISYTEALKLRLRVMDATAFAMCLETNMPILVFNMNEPGSIRRAVVGDKIGTLVH